MASGNEVALSLLTRVPAELCVHIGEKGAATSRSLSIILVRCLPGHQLKHLERMLLGRDANGLLLSLCKEAGKERVYPSLVTAI
jgi:hypothetical protein